MSGGYRLVETVPAGKLSIRSAGPQDKGVLIAFIRRQRETQFQFAPHLRSAASVPWARLVEAKLKDRNRRMLLAEWDGAPAGYVEAGIIRERAGSLRRRVWTLARWAWHGFRRAEPAILQPEIRGIIVEIYVEPAFRRRGIGKALLTEGCRWFEREHVMAVEAWIWAGNAASLGLFGSRGFQVSGQIVRRSLSSGS